MTTPPLPPFPRATPAFVPPVIGGLAAREATLAELGFLRALYRDTRDDELALTGWPDAAKSAFCDSQFDLQHLHYVQQFADGAFLILLREDNPIGRLYLAPEADRLHIVDISLTAPERGRGIGSRIVAALKDMAAAHGRALTLNVHLGNARARALYARLGFATTEENGAHLAMVWRPPAA